MSQSLFDTSVNQEGDGSPELFLCGLTSEGWHKIVTCLVLIRRCQLKHSESPSTLELEL
jgi:hypothetical protein